jgi:hypothetical protein
MVSRRRLALFFFYRFSLDFRFVDFFFAPIADSIQTQSVVQSLINRDPDETGKLRENLSLSDLENLLENCREVEENSKKSMEN